jgi:hypothetical protein
VALAALAFTNGVQYIASDTVTIFGKALLAPLLANLSLSQEIQLKMSPGK